MKRITFEESDYEYPHLEVVADEIASFLYESSSYIFNIFIDFMRTSINFRVDNYKSLVQKWFSVPIKNRKNAAPDILKLEEICECFFEVCQTDEEITKMRGLVPEKLFELIFEKRHTGKDCTIGYGVKVLIDGKTILYRPEKPFVPENDSDGNRQTVDAGFWDGSVSEFAEVKLQPCAFQTKDVKYLKLLADELNGNNIPYTIFLVALGDKDLIRKKLQRLDLINKVSEEFILIGKDELFQLEIIA